MECDYNITNRSKAEIISLILQSTITESSKMKIMYDTYLTYVQVKEYLEFLWKNDLIDYNWKTRHYKITVKGKKCLADPKEINKLRSSQSMKKTDEDIIVRWY